MPSFRLDPVVVVKNQSDIYCIVPGGIAKNEEIQVSSIVESGITEVAKKKGILICFFAWVNLILFSYHRICCGCDRQQISQKEERLESEGAVRHVPPLDWSNPTLGL